MVAVSLKNIVVPIRIFRLFETLIDGLDVITRNRVENIVEGNENTIRGRFRWRRLIERRVGHLARGENFSDEIITNGFHRCRLTKVPTDVVQRNLDVGKNIAQTIANQKNRRMLIGRIEDFHRSRSSSTYHIGIRNRRRRRRCGGRGRGSRGRQFD